MKELITNEITTEEFGLKPKRYNLESLGLFNFSKIFWNLSVPELVQHAIRSREVKLTDTGALAFDTGNFKGRSPQDKFVVFDNKTEENIWWGEVNHKFMPNDFENLYNRIKAYLIGKEIYVRNMSVCAHSDFRQNITVISEFATANIFCNNMFIRLDKEEIIDFLHDWTVICVPHFYAIPTIDKTRSKNFVVINFTTKMVLIGGTGYTGEIKKSVFSILNYILPLEKGVLPMHCSANTDSKHNTAIFFGLSGTGKTTLSADPNRSLIGDDEHGWSDKNIFNFEGGCYAKCANLTREKEPEIFDAIKFGALLENVSFFPGTYTVNYANIDKTENTRVSYPLEHIPNIIKPSIGGLPRNIIFLTCDAYGILPPISKLNPAEAMFHYLSGYTAKVAGTEIGINEPQAVFSACYGQPFLPLHPSKYAQLLGEKIKKHKTNIWLINTGWIGGAYGVGKRISLKYTRSLLSAAMNGKLDNAKYDKMPVFKLSFPTSCPDIPQEILNPMNSWADKDEYISKAKSLAKKFNDNFKKYVSMCENEIVEASHFDF